MHLRVANWGPEVCMHLFNVVLTDSTWPLRQLDTRAVRRDCHP